jgi:muramoyltetrapeptide carboxypeptidase
MNILKPPRLKNGDIIGLIAPASAPSSDEKIQGGVRYLESLGYRVRLGAHVQDRYGYLAGTDADRASDFNAMVRAKEVKAIFTVRGGYGSLRILSMIDYRMLAQNPKIIVGYSDITALQLAILRKSNLVTFSGPMTGVEMWKDIDPYTEEHFWRSITSNKKIGELRNPPGEPASFLQTGKARGRLVGGNLSLVVSLLGSHYMPSTRGAILLLEDIDEEPYRIDRMLAQLLNTGTLRGLAALVCGKFTDCASKEPETPGFTTPEVLAMYTEMIKCPVLSEFQYGHVPQKLTIPWGLNATLDIKTRSLDVLESGVV